MYTPPRPRRETALSRLGWKLVMDPLGRKPSSLLFLDNALSPPAVRADDRRDGPAMLVLSSPS
jgi:hypothetical protein